jgi:phage major head subunit gpT-like protein
MDVKNNPALVTLFFKEIMEPAFNNAYNGTLKSVLAEKIAMQVPSTGISSIHGWVNQIGRMSEWVGPRIAKNISTNGLEVFNRTFENNLEITVAEFLSDAHSMYGLIQGPALGVDAAFNRDRLLLEAMLRGLPTSTNPIVWADGVTTFANGSTVGDGSTRSFDGVNIIKNYTTDPLTPTSLRKACNTMNNYIGHGGQNLLGSAPGMVKFTLLHGSILDEVATKILDSEYMPVLAPDGTTWTASGGNPNYHLMGHEISNLFNSGFIDAKGTKYDASLCWCIIAEFMGVKPLCYQSWQDPFFQYARATMDSEYCYAHDALQWGVTARGEGFVCIPWLMFFGNASTAWYTGVGQY